ncbi:MAG TPA: DUF1345 domain-containing protein [Acidimicrobiia bacterium]|nr:DUF1345 domain-containing protein [Acidimicrobiia bacterium]
MNRFDSARSRVVLALGAGTLAVVVVAWFAPWQITVLAGWDVAALVVLLRVWTHIWRFDAGETQAWAMQEDDTRTGAEVLLLCAGVISLVGVGFAFLKAQEHPGSREILLEALGIITIALSWLVVHTTYALRYAHVYYTAPEGGIDFKQGREYRPDYRDFAYTAFTVGMTYQVSDTDVTKRELRHQVLKHAVLSFVFGAVIIGATVNIVAGLLNS